jgi:hypothetical protein
MLLPRAAGLPVVHWEEKAGRMGSEEQVRQPNKENSKLPNNNYNEKQNSNLV